MDEYLEIKGKLDEFVAADKVDGICAVEVLSQFSILWEKFCALPSVIDDLGSLITITLHFVFSTEQSVRKPAVLILEKIQIYLSLNLHLKQKQWWSNFKLYIEQCGVNKVVNLMNCGSDEWPVVWCVLARMVGEEMNASLGTVNALLRILEKAFKSKSADQDKERQAAFECWKSLIDGFALNKEPLSKRRLDILLIPLKAPNHSAKLVCETKLQTWMYLITVMGVKNETSLSLYVPPFIEFLYVGNRLVPPACQLIQPNRCASEFITLIKNSYIFKHQSQLLVKSSLKCIESIKEDSSQLYHVVWCNILDGLRKLCDGYSGDASIVDSTINEFIGVIKNLSLSFSRTEFARFVFSSTQGKTKLPQLKNYYESIIDTVLDYDILTNLDTEVYAVIRSVLDLYQPKERSTKIFSYAIARSEAKIDGVKSVDLNVFVEIWAAICSCLIESAPWIFSSNEFDALYEILLFPIKYLLPCHGENSGRIMVHWKDLLSSCLKAADNKQSSIIGNELVNRLSKGKFSSCSLVLEMITIVVELTDSCNISPFLSELSKELENPSSDLFSINFISALSDSILKFTKKNPSSGPEMLDFANKLGNIKNDQLKTSLNKIVSKLKNTLSSMNNTTPKKNSRFLHRLARAKEMEYKRQNNSPGSSPQSMFVIKNNVEKKLVSPSIKTPSKKSVDEDSQEFVMVPPKARSTPLTEHQKENLSKRKFDIPALYQDLSQDTQSLDRIEVCITENANPAASNSLKHESDFPDSKTKNGDISLQSSNNRKLKIEKVQVKEDNIANDHSGCLISNPDDIKNDDVIVNKEIGTGHNGVYSAEEAIVNCEDNMKEAGQLIENGMKDDEICTTDDSAIVNVISVKSASSDKITKQKKVCRKSISGETNEVVTKPKKVARKSISGENNEAVRKSTRKRVNKISPQKLLGRKKRKSSVKTCSAPENSAPSQETVCDTSAESKTETSANKSHSYNEVVVPFVVVEDAVFPERPNSYLVSEISQDTCRDKSDVDKFLSNQPVTDVAVDTKITEPSFDSKLNESSRSFNLSSNGQIDKVVKDNKIDRSFESDKNNKVETASLLKSQNSEEYKNISVILTDVIADSEVNKIKDVESKIVKKNLDVVKDIKPESTPIRRLRSKHKTNLPRSPCVCCDSSNKNNSSESKKSQVNQKSKGASRSLFLPNSHEDLNVIKRQVSNIGLEKEVPIVYDETVESTINKEVTGFLDIETNKTVLKISSDPCNGSGTPFKASFNSENKSVIDIVKELKNNYIDKNGRTPCRKRKIAEENLDESDSKKRFGEANKNIKNIEEQVLTVAATEISGKRFDECKSSHQLCDNVKGNSSDNDVKIMYDNKCENDDDQCTQEELNDSVSSILCNSSPSPKSPIKSLKRSFPLSKLFVHNESLNNVLADDEAITLSSEKDISKKASDILCNGTEVIVESLSQNNTANGTFNLSSNKKIPNELPIKSKSNKRLHLIEVYEPSSAKIQIINDENVQCNAKSSDSLFDEEKGISGNISSDVTPNLNTNDSKNAIPVASEDFIVQNDLETKELEDKLFNCSHLSSSNMDFHDDANSRKKQSVISAEEVKRLNEAANDILKKDKYLGNDVNSEEITCEKLEYQTEVTKKVLNSSMKSGFPINSLDKWVIRKHKKALNVRSSDEENLANKLQNNNMYSKDNENKEHSVKEVKNNEAFEKDNENETYSAKQVQKNVETFTLLNSDFKDVFVVADSEEIVCSSQEPSYSVSSIIDCVNKHEGIIETTVEQENICEPVKFNDACVFKNNEFHSRSLSDKINTSLNEVSDEFTDIKNYINETKSKLVSDESKSVCAVEDTNSETGTCTAETEIMENKISNSSISERTCNNIESGLPFPVGDKSSFNGDLSSVAAELGTKDDLMDGVEAIPSEKSLSNSPLSLNDTCLLDHQEKNDGGILNEVKCNDSDLISCKFQDSDTSLVQSKKLHVCRRLVDDLTENKTDFQTSEGKSEVEVLGDDKLFYKKVACKELELDTNTIEDSVIENKENVVDTNEKSKTPAAAIQIRDSDSVKLESKPDRDVKIQEKKVIKCDAIIEDKKSFKRPDILSNKQKNIENRQSTSPTGPGSKCRQHLFNNISPEKSSVCIENQNSSPQSTRGRTAHLMELVCGSDSVTRPPRPSTPRRLNPIKIGNCTPILSSESSGENWICKTYSPHALPSPSILKARTAQDDTSPPPSKKKRVNFHDPPVSRSLLFAPKQFGRGTIVECVKKSGNTDGSEELDTQSQGSLQLTDQTSDSTKVIWPSLIGCNHPVSAITSKLISKEWVQELENNLLSIDIADIGKLSSLTESVVERVLPIKPPKVERLRAALKVYEMSLCESNDNFENQLGSGECTEKLKQFNEGDKKEFSPPKESCVKLILHPSRTNSVESTAVDETYKLVKEFLSVKSPEDICDLLDEKTKLNIIKGLLHEHCNGLSQDSEIFSIISNCELRDSLLKNLLTNADQDMKCELIVSVIKENRCFIKKIMDSVDKEVKIETFSSEFTQDSRLLESVVQNPLVSKEIIQNNELMNYFYKCIDRETKVKVIARDLNNDSDMLNDILCLTDCKTIANSINSTLNDNSKLVESIVKNFDMKTSVLFMKLISEKLYKSVRNETE